MFCFMMEIRSFRGDLANEGARTKSLVTDDHKTRCTIYCWYRIITVRVVSPFPVQSCLGSRASVLFVSSPPSSLASSCSFLTLSKCSGRILLFSLLFKVVLLLILVFAFLPELRDCVLQRKDRRKAKEKDCPFPLCLPFYLLTSLFCLL